MFDIVITWACAATMNVKMRRLLRSRNSARCWGGHLVVDRDEAPVILRVEHPTPVEHPEDLLHLLEGGTPLVLHTELRGPFGLRLEVQLEMTRPDGHQREMSSKAVMGTERRVRGSFAVAHPRLSEVK